MADGALFSVGLWPVLTVAELIGLVVALGALVAIRRRLRRVDVESHQRLDIAARANGIGLWSLDLRTNALTWDDRMFALYGRDPANFPGAYEVWRESLHPDDLDRAETVYRQAVDGSASFDTQFRIVRPDGTIRHIRAFAQVLRDRRGQPTRMVGTNTDVTEQAEQAERLSRLASTVPGVVFQLRCAADGGLTIPLFSGSLVDGLGLDRDRLAEDASALFDRVHSGDRDALREAMETSARDLTVWSREVQMADADDAPRWLAVQATPEGLPDGSVLWHGVLTDITERRAAERQRDALAAVVEASDDIIVIKDLDLRVVATNPAFAAASGHASVAALIGRTDAEIFGLPEDRDPIRTYMADERRAQGLPRGAVIAREEPVVRPDGSVGYVLTRKYPIHDRRGVLIGTGNISVDITDRKAAEEAARITHERYVESQLIGRVGHWRRDLRTEEVTWSRGVYAIFGLAPGAFSNTYADALGRIDPRDQAIVAGALERIAATGQPETYTFRIRRSDGERIIWNQGYREADADGTPIAVFGVVRDVTEEQTRLDALEEERSKALELMQLAQDASLAKSRFLATMSHELRTPLNAIIGFSEMMALETLGPMAPAYANYPGHVLDSAQLLLSLIDDILDLSRVESGRREIAAEALDVTEEIDACVRTVAMKAREKSLDLRTDIAPGTGPLVADRRSVRQILLNLLSNALKFTPGGGRVTIRASGDPDGGVRLTVEDTGIGIPEEDRDGVFNAFRRSRDADRRAIQGTGLGLTLVKALMDLHGGQVSLDSTAGRGTAVTVVFPPPGAEPAVAASGTRPVSVAKAGSRA
jgi:PAS domain S-box-containing protein